MIRINVLADGSVTGDVSRVVAYEGQNHSEEIQFSYPAIGSEYIKYVKYIQGCTTMENMLDANDRVELCILNVGIIKAQFLAKHALTGEVYLASKPFELIVHAGVNPGPDTFTNCYRKGCKPPYTPNYPSNGSVEQMVKFGIELEQEESVRASQDSLIWEELFKIKNALSAAGINTIDPIPTVEDCNLLVDMGEYHLKEGSINTPDGAEACISPWIVQVKRYGAQCLQTAYSADDGDTRIYYRTGTLFEGSDTLWLDWIPMLHEAAVEEI